jgi:hypothetical protein
VYAGSIPTLASITSRTVAGAAPRAYDRPMPVPSARRNVILALAATAALAGCAVQETRPATVAVATPASTELLRADARENERVRRWIAKKQLCRQAGVRFESSGRCW